MPSRMPPAALVSTHGAAAGGGGGAHPVRDRVDAVALVEVRAAEQHEHAGARRRAPSGSCRRARRPPGGRSRAGRPSRARARARRCRSAAGRQPEPSTTATSCVSTPVAAARAAAAAAAASASMPAAHGRGFRSRTATVRSARRGAIRSRRSRRASSAEASSPLPPGHRRAAWPEHRRPRPGTTAATTVRSANPSAACGTTTCVAVGQQLRSRRVAPVRSPGRR